LLSNCGELGNASIHGRYGPFAGTNPWALISFAERNAASQKVKTNWHISVIKKWTFRLRIAIEGYYYCVIK
jgi:hypothetical protein